MKRRWMIGMALFVIVLVVAACVVPPPVPAPAAPAVEEPAAPPAPEPTAEPVAEPVVEPTTEPAAEAPAPEMIELDNYTLGSVMAEAAPVLDGMADDAAWANAPVAQFSVKKGANMGETTVNMQSVYMDDMVYFLVSYADPTESFTRSPWVKQDDGSWMVLKDPDDMGGDNNVYYEDKLSMIWNIGNSIPKFETQGCTVACHSSGVDAEVKPYGNKFTDEGMGDMWHWKSVRNIGQLDDQYLDSVGWSAETPSAGRHGDPSDGGGYVTNQSEDKTQPMWMSPDGSFTGSILDSEKVAFDDAAFVAGDMVAGITKSPFTGDRGDLSAGWQYADGMWTLEIGRALVTGSEFDVQFDDLSQPYHFGVAIFDNAQVRHAYQTRPDTFIFVPEGAMVVAPMVEEAAPAVELDAYTLGSMEADAAPVLDGVADDAAWANAPVAQFSVKKGANMGETTVNMQSVFVDDMIYFLVSYADPTESFTRSPWVKQDDGSWMVLKDPDDMGGDNNVYYEDKLSMIWNIGNSIPKFETQGCTVACHSSGVDAEVKPYGNKFTDEGMGDMWHWKSVRNIGQLDDQYLDSVGWSAETPSAGRHSDPSDGGGYVSNQSEDKTQPMWMSPDGSFTGSILDSEKVAFDDAAFVAGDMVAGITKAPFTGDRGDLSAGWQYADGMWTLEIGRALVTGSEYDVQFDDLSQPYHFGVAVFDNAQVRHAYQTRPDTLIFLQK